MIKKIVGLLCVFLTPVVIALPVEGNFALPESQQPGPFYSFGQNVLDKNQLQIYSYPAFLKLDNEHFLTLPLTALYGVSDTASLLLTTPYALSYRDGPYHSTGLEDMTLQGEYAFYNKETSEAAYQMTVVVAGTIPSGSLFKDPSTGYGTPSFFGGWTYNYISVEWFSFVSAGVTAVGKHKGIQFGNQYLYQGGLGHNIKSSPNRYIFAILGELDGTYTNKLHVNGVSRTDSGGNLVYFSPSLWFSTQKLFFQLGVSLPINQAWNGQQPSVQYYASLALGWTFNE